ncbi:hypothetical protein [Limnofasciculus baicalensis]|uniref:Uncharacterized protein n=1 Tax=Limnofasciculus baicalensis BBK-W-15 TaxID=2699891 RepID=A0AAE3GQP5_9CYAN|nr:hypothetical protein [Limnofasciculus baicalensis]MCP2728439.1 hypothetical protein [Limnofasciculus baicalensis BBK-W-15]
MNNPEELTKRERVDGAIVRQDFNKAIEDKGGDKEAHAKSTVALTEELFDCKPKTLYQETRAKQGDRSTLPKEVQKAYIVGEIVATHELNAKEITGNQEERNQEIVDSVRDSGQKARQLFPW